MGENFTQEREGKYSSKSVGAMGEGYILDQRSLISRLWKWNLNNIAQGLPLETNTVAYSVILSDLSHSYEPLMWILFRVPIPTEQCEQATASRNWISAHVRLHKTITGRRSEEGFGRDKRMFRERTNNSIPKKISRPCPTSNCHPLNHNGEHSASDS